MYLLRYMITNGILTRLDRQLNQKRGFAKERTGRKLGVKQANPRDTKSQTPRSTYIQRSAPQSQHVKAMLSNSIRISSLRTASCAYKAITSRSFGIGDTFGKKVRNSVFTFRLIWWSNTHCRIGLAAVQTVMFTSE